MVNGYVNVPTEISKYDIETLSGRITLKKGDDKYDDFFDFINATTSKIPVIQYRVDDRLFTTIGQMISLSPGYINAIFVILNVTISIAIMGYDGEIVLEAQDSNSTKSP